jgi:hypothetical protein
MFADPTGYSVQGAIAAAAEIHPSCARPAPSAAARNLFNTNYVNSIVKAGFFDSRVGLSQTPFFPESIMICLFNLFDS